MNKNKNENVEFEEEYMRDSRLPEPTKEKVREVIKKTKKSRSPGNDRMEQPRTRKDRLLERVHNVTN